MNQSAPFPQPPPTPPLCSYNELLRRQSVDAAAKAAVEAERASRRVHPEYQPEVDWEADTQVGPFPAEKIETVQVESATDWTVRGFCRPTPIDVDGANPKDLAGRCKPDLSLISGTMMAHLAAALQDGVDKYGRANWRQIAVEAMTYTGANGRHVKAWEDGEDFAPDSKVHHLAHAAATLLIVLDAEACKTLIDNRPAPGACPKVFAEMTERRRLKVQPEKPKRTCATPASCHNVQRCLGGPSCPRDFKPRSEGCALNADEGDRFRT